MSDTTDSLRRKITRAGDLQGVVRTMKAMAASSIGQYENSVRALADYYRTVELGLGACIRAAGAKHVDVEPQACELVRPVTAVVFGSDQGLVGQFNDVIATHALQTLTSVSPDNTVLAVGERVHGRLKDAKLNTIGLFNVPNSVEAITPLVGQVLIEYEKLYDHSATAELYLFYNRPVKGAAYEPTYERLLPLDYQWLRKHAEILWPTRKLPQVIADTQQTMRALVREYLFVSLFRACAESLASENASRLQAMQRAEKNIDEMLVALKSTYYRLRQSGIDEELFDVVSGFEALTGIQ